MQRIRLATSGLCVLLIAGLVGCADTKHYVNARADDLSDVARFHAAVGQLGLYAEAEVTSLIKPAVGAADFNFVPQYSAVWHPHREDYTAQVRTAAFPGMLLLWPFYGRREVREGYGDTHPYRRGFLAPLILMGNDHVQETSHSLLFLHKLIPNPRLQPDQRAPSSCPRADPFWIGASGTAGVVSLGAGLNLLEILDFLAGLLTWDPLHDDYREVAVPNDMDSDDVESSEDVMSDAEDVTEETE